MGNIGLGFGGASTVTQQKISMNPIRAEAAEPSAQVGSILLLGKSNSDHAAGEQWTT